ncbi:MAG: Ldh family oxidoreductase [Clostridiales Family XIII bacterium]|nr:Ldh family oxidoreductase [Clostridia bacterium]MDE8734830.1 Ldh family oxidoreductase [Eubacteriales bacterium DFI.9.88]MDY3010540.1 Ldh family oxidoreductase [Clostridiales Family XIII bacterium]
MTVKVDHKEIWQFVADLFQAAGTTRENAQMVADVLIRADLRGIKSHGVSRIPIYIKRMEMGLVNSRAEIRILHETPVSAVIDGGYGLGQITATKAMKLAIEKAKTCGVGMVCMNKSHHYGIAAFYSQMAAEENMIGFSCANTTALMAAPGGASKAIGNSPFSFAFPAKEEMPVIFDAACSAVAQGKIIVANINGQKIPDNWALDCEGNPTTDPAEALKGFLLPMAGPKGYGIAVVMEILSGVLSGSDTGIHLGSIYNDLENPQDCGNFFMAIDLKAFGDPEAFKERMDGYIQDMKNGKKAKNTKEIFMPGEIELKKEIQAKKDGIEIEDDTFAPLVELAKKYKVKLNYK